MAERTSYAAGTPSWIDLGTPDPDAAAAFYSGLFGWTVNDLGPDAGGYRIATLKDKGVAGLGVQMSQDMPPFWSVYVSSEDTDATAAKAVEAGGTVVVEPMDVMEAGRMAVLQDATGSFISVWQPGETIGAELVNEPGTFAWNELATTDLAAARDFYTATFGWGTEGDAESGCQFTVGGEMVCGAHVAGEGEFPAWSVWFAVEDCDASAARATELGATVLMPPNDMDFGRGAVLSDPQGAVFGIGAMGPDVAPPS
ncbi:MAG: Glyoxalase/bleomycin resistance protein/dioxygenase [Acidimicrobiales bacterium]|nr:Glyoxalase/bleomycin resistance protein/dioxygenase [Acidimicrobiales bacterium]